MHVSIKEGDGKRGGTFAVESQSFNCFLQRTDSVKGNIGFPAGRRDIDQEEVSWLLRSSRGIILRSNELVAAQSKLCARIVLIRIHVLNGSGLNFIAEIAFKSTAVIEKFKEGIDKAAALVASRNIVGLLVRLGGVM